MDLLPFTPHHLRLRSIQKKIEGDSFPYDWPDYIRGQPGVNGQLVHLQLLACREEQAMAVSALHKQADGSHIEQKLFQSMGKRP